MCCEKDKATKCILPLLAVIAIGLNVAACVFSTLSSKSLEMKSSGVKRTIKCQFDRYCEIYTDIPEEYAEYIGEGEGFCWKYDDMSDITTGNLIVDALLKSILGVEMGECVGCFDDYKQAGSLWLAFTVISCILSLMAAILICVDGVSYKWTGSGFFIATICGGFAVLFWNTMKAEDTVEKDYGFDNCEDMGFSNYLVISSSVLVAICAMVAFAKGCGESQTSQKAGKSQTEGV